jgi:hypothetical protein
LKARRRIADGENLNQAWVETFRLQKLFRGQVIRTAQRRDPSFLP